MSVYRASSDYEVVGIVEPDAALRAKAGSEPAFRDLPWMTQDQLLDVPGIGEAKLASLRDLVTV